MRRPERVERLVLALATVCVAAVAQGVLKCGKRPRCYSRFQLGLRWLNRLLANGQHVPCLLHLWADAAAPLKLS